METPELIEEEAAAQKLVEDKKAERKKAKKEARLADFKARKKNKRK